jgi:methyltransferase
MCNPPFYKSFYEAQGLENTRKPHERHDPKSINTANKCESIYEDGGEVGFVKKLIDESIQVGQKIRYICLNRFLPFSENIFLLLLRVYTTMLGKKTSLIEIKKYLIDRKSVKNISEASFCQGHTMRWGIAWSFHEKRLESFDYLNVDCFASILVLTLMETCFFVFFFQRRNSLKTKPPRPRQYCSKFQKKN